MSEPQETILDTIAAKTRIRVEESKVAFSFGEAQKQVQAILQQEAPDFPFQRALETPELSFICEVKKASPSKGVIAEDFPYLEIAREYEAAGAAAVSVLTEPYFFLGADSYLREISATIGIPTLRKDFIVDPYQIYEAKLLGAKAILLICALLDKQTLQSYIKLAHELTLSVLVEIHDEAEAEQAMEAGARIIGINNRNLKTFSVDFDLCVKLRNYIPDTVLAVAESGVKTPQDITALKGAKVDAVLIGESVMRSSDKKRFLAELKGA
jgi:indole-3-glycerol phosphate synthase